MVYIACRKGLPFPADALDAFRRAGLRPEVDFRKVSIPYTHEEKLSINEHWPRYSPFEATHLPTWE